ncbi:MAG: Holliday junction resolvase RuvX [Actinomycetaceae bacterium]|nr:Holliday junction resolvase RuvX [Actinomycetaceae bacterium]
MTYNPHCVYYGIDVGLRRIGVSKQEAGTQVVLPVDTLWRSDGDDAIDMLIDVIEEDHTNIMFYIGLPYTMSGSLGPQARSVIEWAKRLQQNCPKSQIRFVDERLSSAGAHKDLHHSGKKMKEHRAVVDQQAAVIILEQALAIQQNRQSPAGLGFDDIATQKGESDERYY